MKNPHNQLPDTIFDNPLFAINTPGAYSDEEIQHCITAYYANVSFMDAQVGRVLDALDEQGLSENTIVVYSSDHGENLFNHQMVQKQCFFEGSVGVPLIVRLPETMLNTLDLKGAHRNQFASLLDLLPTFCEACSLTPPAGSDGKSLLPAVLDDAPTRDAVYSEFYEFGIAERMLRTDDYKYVHSEGDLHQLYYLTIDLAENNNLIDDPGYREIARELDQRLFADWDIPDTTSIPRHRGDTRPGQKSAQSNEFLQVDIHNCIIQN